MSCDRVCVIAWMCLITRNLFGNDRESQCVNTGQHNAISAQIMVFFGFWYSFALVVNVLLFVATKINASVFQFLLYSSRLAISGPSILESFGPLLMKDRQTNSQTNRKLTELSIRRYVCLFLLWIYEIQSFYLEQINGLL